MLIPRKAVLALCHPDMGHSTAPPRVAQPSAHLRGENPTNKLWLQKENSIWAWLGNASVNNFAHLCSAAPGLVCGCVVLLWCLFPGSAPGTSLRTCNFDYSSLPSAFHWSLHLAAPSPRPEGHRGIIFPSSIWLLNWNFVHPKLNKGSFHPHCRQN